MPNYQNTPIRQTTPEEEAALRRLAGTPRSPQSAMPGLPSPPPGMQVKPVTVAPGITTNIAKPYEQRGGPVGRPTPGTTPMKQATAALRVPAKPAAQPTTGIGLPGQNVLRTPSEQAMAPLATPRPPVPAPAPEDAPIRGSLSGSRPGWVDRVGANLRQSMTPRPAATKPMPSTDTAYGRGAFARELVGKIVPDVPNPALLQAGAVIATEPNRQAAAEFGGGLVGLQPPAATKPDATRLTTGLPPGGRDRTPSFSDTRTTGPEGRFARTPMPATAAPAPAGGPPLSVPYSPVGPNQVEQNIGRPLPPPGMVEVIRPSAAGGFQFTNELGGDIRPVGMDDRTAREFGGFRNAGLTAPDAMQGVEILRGAETNARQAEAQMMQARAAQTEAQTRASALERSIGSEIFIADPNDMSKGSIGFVRRDANGQLVIEQTPITSYRPVEQYTVKLGYEVTDRTGEKVKREAVFNTVTGEKIADSGEEGAASTGKQKAKSIAPPRNLPPEATTEWNQAISFAGQYTNVESEMRQLAMDALRRKYPQLSDEAAEE